MRSIKQQVGGTPSWARPKVRYGLVALLSAAVLAGGASANMINVAATSTSHAVAILHHLSSSSSVKKSSKVTFSSARQTPAQAQYATAKPKVSIKKGPNSQSVAVGGTATFTISVTNTGNVDLTGVAVTDTLSPNCDKTIGALAVGKSASYTCTAVNVQKSFTNVATVKGNSSGGTAADSDTAKVKAAPLAPPSRPSIKVSKGPGSQSVTTKIEQATGPDGATITTVSYSKATFKISVKNTGNVALSNVTVKDAQSPACNRTFSSLASGKSKTYTCTAVAHSTFTNVAIASGKPKSGPRVSGTSGNAVVTVKSVTISHKAPKNTG